MGPGQTCYNVKILKTKQLYLWDLPCKIKDGDDISPQLSTFAEKPKESNLHLRMTIIQRIKSYRNSPTFWFWLGLALLALIGMALVYQITPMGMGLVNDSVAYLRGARNILDGEGYTRFVGDGNTAPITHFPPMFSFVIVSVGFFGLDVLRAARLINIVCFGLNVFLIGVLIYRMSGLSWFGIAGAVFFLVSEPLLGVHTYALSEPLYLSISFTVLLLLAVQIESPRWYLVAVAGVLTGFAYLTRYVGVAMYATGLAVLLFMQPTWKRRILDIGIFLLTSIPGVAVWSLRNIRVSGNAANRPVYWHPLSTDKWNEGLGRFWGWLLPEAGGLIEDRYWFWGIVIAVLLLALAVWVVVTTIRYIKGQIGSGNRFQVMVLIGAAHGLAYIAGLIIAMTFFDDKTIFEQRMLAPFYVSILIVIMALLIWLWERPQRGARGTVLVIGVLVLISCLEDTVDTVSLLSKEGQGYASGRWRNSETIAAVDDIPDDIMIFSNKITALDILADRPAFLIPWRYEPEGMPDPTYEGAIARYQQLLFDRDVVFVIFDYNEEVRLGNERVIDLTRDMPIEKELSDGIIFGIVR